MAQVGVHHQKYAVLLWGELENRVSDIITIQYFKPNKGGQWRADAQRWQDRKQSPPLLKKDLHWHSQVWIKLNHTSAFHSQPSAAGFYDILIWYLQEYQVLS